LAAVASAIVGSQGEAPAYVLSRPEPVDEAQAQEAARAELRAILAASRAERAALREEVRDARRRLQRIAYGTERADLR
jgi:hypothetical protein